MRAILVFGTVGRIAECLIALGDQALVRLFAGV